VSSTGGKSSRGRNDDNRQGDLQEARRMAPFVASLDKLAAVHEGMARERAREREQEDKRASLEMVQLERKRKFERMCELRDLGCQYKRDRMQLDNIAENFTVLKGFYDEEINSIEVELFLNWLVLLPPDNSDNS
jgi:hypothetical protein